MSELPQGWVAACISDMLSIRNGYAFKSTDFCDEGILLIRQSELRGGTVDVKNAVFLPKKFLLDHQTYSISKGDVLIGMSGSLGKVSRYLDDRPALQNQRTGLLAVNDDVADRTFSLYALKYVEPQILAQGKGVAVQNVSSSQIESCYVSLPPRKEQTRIVAKLEELLSDLDAGVAELKAAQKKLAQYRQSLLKAAVEGALTAEWRAKNTPTETGAQLLERILQERRARWEAKQLAKFESQGKAPPKGWQAKYPEPVQPDTTDLPELPEGWVWASLDQLVAESSYGTSVKCNYESSGLPVLRIPNVSGGKLDVRDMKFSITDLGLAAEDYLAVGDILVIRTNGSVGLVGRAAVVVNDLPTPHYFASYLLRLRCTEITIVHRWILAMLTANTGRQWLEARAASSAGQHNISLSTLLTMPIPLPPIAEQIGALAEVEECHDLIKQQESAVGLSIKQSIAQRQNILRAAFAGQLVPQDPNDEPASVLLERIRAERAAQAAVKKPRGRPAKEAA